MSLKLFIYVALALALLVGGRQYHHHVYQQGYHAREQEESTAQATQLAKDAASIPTLQKADADRRAVTRTVIIEAKHDLPPTACFNTDITDDDASRLLNTGAGGAARSTPH